MQYRFPSSLRKPTIFVSGLLLAFVSSGVAQQGTAPAFAPTAPQTFEGRGDWSRANVTGLPTGASSAWTINMFVRPETALYELTLIGGFGDGRDVAGTQRYIGRIGGGIHFWGGGVDLESDVPFDVGGWQMISATYDGQKVTLYKNGEAIGTAAATFKDASPQARLAPTGTWPSQEQHQFKGRVQGFAVWNGALSPSALQELMKGMPKK